MAGALLLCAPSAAQAAAPPVITSGAPTAATLDVPYNFQLTATSADPVTYSIAGALPDGVSMSATGDISGLPTSIGSYPIIVKASNGTPPDTDVDLTIVVSAPATPVFNHDHGLLPSVHEGEDFSYSLRASGSDPNLAFVITEGSLPNGLDIDDAGLITGKPMAILTPATFFVVDAQLGGVTVARKRYSIFVSPPTSPVFTLTTASDAAQGQPYSFQPVVTSPVPPMFSFMDFVSGPGDPVFPDGLTIDPHTGLVSGPVTAEPGSNYEFIVQADNGSGTPTTQSYRLTVTAAPTTPTPTPTPTTVTVPATTGGAGSTGTTGASGGGYGSHSLASTGLSAEGFGPWALGSALLLLIGAGLVRLRQLRRSGTKAE